MSTIKKIVNICFFALKHPLDFYRYLYFWNSVRKTLLFDKEYYEKTYPDIINANVFPMWHFFKFGFKERRNPSQNFDTQYYLDNNQDVAMKEVNPLLHYIEWGQEEGRLPKKMSNALDNNKSDLEKINILRVGGIFDEEFYLKTNPEIIESGMDAATHFYYIGHQQGFAPCPHFSWKFYSKP